MSRGRHWRDAPPAVKRAWRLRWRLQRRIFVWFGAAILVTAAITGTVVGVTGASGWKRDWNAMQSFASHRFEHVWDEPREREELARSIHEDLRVGVIVQGERGAVLTSFGVCEGMRVEVPVTRAGSSIGHVTLCSERHRGGVNRPWIAVLVALVVLWAASHAIASRLARPLVEIEKVARAIAGGDLTSRVDLERVRGEEAQLLGATLNEMAERIERQIAGYKSLLATVSHEIRTPLSRMRLLVELASAKDARLLELDREIQDLDDLVGELLALSRVDLAAKRQRLLVLDVALRALEDARVDPSTLAIADAKLEAEADPTLLARAIRNLLENATRHGGGVSRFTVRAERNEIVFEVEDEGPGVPEGQEDRIFEPFEKLSSDDKSVGLGLTLVRRIALAHGGRAYAKNRRPKGAIFGFTLERK